jgi:hypothetical protein
MYRRNLGDFFLMKLFFFGILAILKLKKSVQFIIFKFHFFKISIQGVCVTHCGLAIYIKKYLKAKEK